jgi:hypothetical protein
MSRIYNWWNSSIGVPSGQVFGLIFSIVLIYLCFALSNSKIEPSINILIVMIGVILGWPVGVYFSPFNKEDAKRLSVIGKSAAAFVSGYLLSKIEPIIQAQIEIAKSDISSMPWLQLGLFVSAFLLSAVLVFEGRSYALSNKTTSTQKEAIP